MQDDISIPIHHQVTWIGLIKGFCLGVLMEPSLLAVAYNPSSMPRQAKVAGLIFLYRANDSHRWGKLHFRAILSMQIQGREEGTLLWVGMNPAQSKCSLLLMKVYNILLLKCSAGVRGSALFGNQNVGHMKFAVNQFSCQQSARLNVALSVGLS